MKTFYKKNLKQCVRFLVIALIYFSFYDFEVLPVSLYFFDQISLIAIFEWQIRIRLGFNANTQVKILYSSCI